MAAKKGKVSRKYRQATSAAKKDAAAFTEGKVKAVRKDSKVKISAEDKEAFRNIRKETKGGFITDEKGNKIKVNVESTADRVARDKASIRSATDRPEFMEKRAAEQEARSAKAKAEAMKRNEAAKEKARARFAQRKPNTSLIAASEPKPQSKVVGKVNLKEDKLKKAIGSAEKLQRKTMDMSKSPTKPAAKYPALINKPGDEGKAFKSNKTFGQISKEVTAGKKATPAKAPAKAAAKPATKKPTVKKTETKATGTKKPTLTKAEMDQKVRTTLDRIARDFGKPTPVKVKSTVVSSKPNVPGKEVAVRPKGTVVSTATKEAAKKTAKKFTAKGAALGAAKLASKAVTGKVGLAVTAGSVLAGPLIKQLTKDKNRVTSADVMKAREQAAIKANAAKKTAATARVKDAGPNKPTRVKDYESSGMTRTGGYGGSGSSVGAGGSTYKVNAGDTLSGIAKRAGVTLSELRAANTNIKDPKKIYRNTTIKIPAKGKVPTGGYTGPVPYRPKKK